MNWRKTRKSDGRARGQQDVALPEVESILVSTFKPVAPRTDFVQDLRSRLEDPQVSQPGQQSSLLFFILIGTGAAATALIVAGLIRLAFELAGALNVLKLHSRQAQ